MKTPNPTVANSDLWAHYLRQQWGRWLDPPTAVTASESFGAGLSTMFTLALGDFITRLFEDNAVGVSAFVEEAGVVNAAALRRSGRARQERVPRWLRAEERISRPREEVAAPFFERAPVTTAAAPAGAQAAEAPG